jgi:stress response protein YsnF
MAYETIVAAFDTAEHAAAAVRALKAGGFHDSDISLFDRDRFSGSNAAGLQQPGVWNRLLGGTLFKHEAHVYGAAIEQGGTVVTVRVPDSEVAHATGILDLHRPVDVHDRAITSGIAPAAHVEAAATQIAAQPLAAAQTVAVTPKVAAVHGEVLRLAEEQLEVGKQLVDSGRARVRRFVTEREVEENVTLHEEHAELLRHALSEPARLADVDWSDAEIEVVETAEHALVNKTARIIEEIELKKVGTDHVETIHEKLRRQQAEFVRVDANGKPIA